MKTLIFRDETINVEYKTDLVGDNDGNFTVHQITNIASDSDVFVDYASQIPIYQRREYHLKTFMEYAVENNLQLVMRDDQTGTEEILVELDSSISGSVSLETYWT